MVEGRRVSGLPWAEAHAVLPVRPVLCLLCPKIGTGGDGGVRDVSCGVDDRRCEMFLRSCQSYGCRHLPSVVLCNHRLKWIWQAADEEVELMKLAVDADL